MKIKFHQINVRELKDEAKKIKELSCDPNNALIGLEVTIPEISKLLSINIDPQHSLRISDSCRKKTCLEKTLDALYIIEEAFRDRLVHVFLLKPDLDSISAAGVLDLHFNDEIDFNNDILKRINAIAEYDRHGRRNELSPEIRIPRGLFMFISGWKNNIREKIEATKSWILLGTFNNIGEFNKIAFTNFKDFIFGSKIETVLYKKLVFVRSTRRGACGLGYKLAPIVVALNPSYRFGYGESRVYGRKWIIAQKHDGYLRMKKVLNALNKIEGSWGGSSTIIGSPLDRPSKLTKEEIIDIVKKNINFAKKF